MWSGQGVQNPFTTPKTVVWWYLRCPRRRKQVNSGKNSFLAIERPNFEAGYLGQFLDLDELIGDTVGTKYKVTFPTPKTVV